MLPSLGALSLEDHEADTAVSRDDKSFVKRFLDKRKKDIKKVQRLDKREQRQREFREEKAARAAARQQAKYNKNQAVIDAADAIDAGWAARLSADVAKEETIESDEVLKMLDAEFAGIYAYLMSNTKLSQEEIAMQTLVEYQKLEGAIAASKEAVEQRNSTLRDIEAAVEAAGGKDALTKEQRKDFKEKYQYAKKVKEIFQEELQELYEEKKDFDAKLMLKRPDIAASILFNANDVAPTTPTAARAAKERSEQAFDAILAMYNVGKIEHLFERKSIDIAVQPLDVGGITILLRSGWSRSKGLRDWLKSKVHPTAAIVVSGNPRTNYNVRAREQGGGNIAIVGAALHIAASKLDARLAEFYVEFTGVSAAAADDAGM